MVSGYYNSGCTCGGGTTTAATYDWGGTATTASDTCGCCQRHGHVTLTSLTTATEEEAIIAEKPPPQWDIIRTVLYIILRLRHHVESRARSPPNMRNQLARTKADSIGQEPAGSAALTGYNFLAHGCEADKESKMIQTLKCFFGKHEFIDSGKTGYVACSDEMFMGYYAKIRKCKHCPAIRPGATVAEEEHENNSMV